MLAISLERSRIQLNPPRVGEMRTYLGDRDIHQFREILLLCVNVFDAIPHVLEIRSWRYFDDLGLDLFVRPFPIDFLLLHIGYLITVFIRDFSSLVGIETLFHDDASGANPPTIRHSAWFCFPKLSLSSAFPYPNLHTKLVFVNTHDFILTNLRFRCDAKTIFAR